MATLTIPPDLPPLLRLSAELRNRIYELILLDREPVAPFVSWRLPTTANLAFLLTNRMIYSEASPIYYGRNQFRLSPFTQSAIHFLTKIGRNAKLLREIRIHFPVFIYVKPAAGISEVGLKMFAAIRDQCTNIDKLTIGPTSEVPVIDVPEGLDTSHVIQQALAAMNAELQSIPTLTGTTVILTRDGQAEGYRSEMEKYGWRVTTTPSWRSIDSDDSDG